ncbi:DUF2591 domain-containing protein [Yersinia intermedia]|nr:DUF2591 domain-containing protein [Yersinia sp. FDAARGOS_228]AVL35853.1 DUF2591 domain-containing protein [Yersinia intermedia]
MRFAARQIRQSKESAMKDYLAMSDDEISKEVGNYLGLEWANLDENYNKLCHWHMAVGLSVFDPCKNIDDAWKIISENRINVEWHEMKDDTFKPYALSNETMIGYYDDSALRAAMIVFLMMKDRESSHG